MRKGCTERKEGLRFLNGSAIIDICRKRGGVHLARPQRRRRVCGEPPCTTFLPEGRPEAGVVTLTIDEFEALRLIDYGKMTHEQCAERMEISRTTVTEIYESARQKIADTIVNGKYLHIAGGTYRLCEGVEGKCCGRRCEKSWQIVGANEKGENKMKIAVTYENGQIFQHFGHTEQFKLYTTENRAVCSTEVVSTNGSGHGALADVLRAYDVDILICGGIGGGAQNALTAAGIRFYGGVTGDADQAVESLLDGTLTYNPNVACNHHDHEHHGEHSCGGHGHSCGSHGCH